VVHVVGLIDSLYAPPLPQRPRVMQKRVAAHQVALKVGSRFFSWSIVKLFVSFLLALKSQPSNLSLYIGGSRIFNIFSGLLYTTRPFSPGPLK